MSQLTGKVLDDCDDFHGWGMFARAASEHDVLNSMIDHLGTGTINPPMTVTKGICRRGEHKGPRWDHGVGKTGRFSGAWWNGLLGCLASLAMTMSLTNRQNRLLTNFECFSP